MVSKILFLMVFFLLTGSCGKKSMIKNHVKAETLACAYGDCKHIIRNLTFPLDDSALAYETPLPGLGPIAGGIIKFVGDIFAKNTTMGKLQMSYTQPIPEIPQEVHSVRLKRFFFYMKPLKVQRRTFRGTLRDWLNRYILGKGHTTFAFLDKLAVRLSTANVDNPATFEPAILNTLGSIEYVESLMKVFDKNFRPDVIDTEIAEELILLKYSNDTRDKDTSNKQFGKIHYLETSKSPADLKKFFHKEKKLQGLIKRILLLQGSILIELSRDPVSDEIFKNIMSVNADKLDKTYGVNFIDTCTENSCLEVNVPNVNIIPIAIKGNALRLEAIIHAEDVPDSFKLKGFVEFEAKIDSDA